MSCFFRNDLNPTLIYVLHWSRSYTDLDPTLTYMLIESGSVRIIEFRAEIWFQETIGKIAR